MCDPKGFSRLLTWRRLDENSEDVALLRHIADWLTAEFDAHPPEDDSRHGHALQRILGILIDRAGRLNEKAYLAEDSDTHRALAQLAGETLEQLIEFTNILAEETDTNNE